MNTSKRGFMKILGLTAAAASIPAISAPANRKPAGIEEISKLRTITLPPATKEMEGFEFKIKAGGSVTIEYPYGITKSDD